MVHGRFRVSFDWAIYTKGYEVTESGQLELRDRQPNGPSPFELRRARPLDDEPGLFLTFAGLDPEEKEAVEDFAGRFGNLWSRSGPALEEPLIEWMRAASAMRHAVREWNDLAGRNGPEADATVDLRALHERLTTTLTNAIRGVTLGVVPQEDGTSTITATPPDLVTGMWCQLAVAVAEQKDFKKCASDLCDRWIEITHSKGGTRSTRQFCSHACRMRWTRAQAAKRSEAEQERKEE